MYPPELHDAEDFFDDVDDAEAAYYEGHEDVLSDDEVVALEANAQPDPVLYTVKAGDKLARLAHLQGVRAVDVAKVNPEVEDFENLVPGTVLRLP